MNKERLIKKYANRRLYDSSQSKHVTLDDIRGIIVQGESIKVLEDKTGDDITRHILLQVIAEQEHGGRPILSARVLESLIRFYGNQLQGFLATYLERSVETFLQQQEIMQTQLSKVASTSPLAATMTELTRSNLELWAKMQESLLNSWNAPRESAREKKPNGQTGAPDDEPKS
jgi:polyhydroxyalkanoate synthesis repressor PhaR